MRHPALPRRIVVAAAITGALAAAAAGCGREGDLIARDTATTPPAATTRTEPATGTTPLTPTPPADGTGTDGTTTSTAPREPTAASPDDAQLRRAAAEHARDRFRLPVTPDDVTLVRSRRKPRWAIASGTYGRTPWVVWLRDGQVALATTDAARFDPISVPCDVRPAFSEPSC